MSGLERIAAGVVIFGVGVVAYLIGLGIAELWNGPDPYAAPTGNRGTR